jgi:hypothetical protein
MTARSNASISIPFEDLRILARGKNAHRHLIGIAPGLGRHLPKSRQNIECIETAAANGHPAVAILNGSLGAMRELTPDEDGWVRLLDRFRPRPQRLEFDDAPWYSATSFVQIAFIAAMRSRIKEKRVLKSVPWLAISSAFHPPPIPKTKRPPLR